MILKLLRRPEVWAREIEMDIRGMLDALAETDRITRGQYQLTISTAIKKLEDANQEAVISFDGGRHPCLPDSYRGYYSDLAFAAGNEERTVSGFLEDLKDALGKTFIGYKGGNFVMTEDTPLWCAPYGGCGPAMMDIIASSDKVTITTKETD